MEANPYAAPVTTVAGEIPLLDDPVGIRTAHINHEASVKSVGTLYFLGGIILGFWTLFNAYALITGHEYAKESAWSLVACLALVTALQLWLGVGLRKLKKSARGIAAILSAIGLIGVPLGTVISAYILYLLMSRKGKTVFSPEYRQVIEATPDIKYKTSKVMWAVLMIFGLVILAIIILGIIAAVTSAAKGA
jgi:hypothetical protein